MASKPIVRLSQKFEFSATHRLHNPALSDEANRSTFGKCNNPFGHGHNYEVQVTLAGEPDASGLLSTCRGSSGRWPRRVIDRFDHKNLNVELPEFATRSRAWRTSPG
jgi:6-pyruvoyltetrahydropterin/6-carboxytetrahydropterin synthase